MMNFSEYGLGHTSDTLQIQTREENRLAALQMAQQAKSTLEILSRDLCPDVYDNVEFMDAVKQLVLNNKRSQVRIITFETNTIVTRGHRLINLAMDLSSFIECRNPSPAYQHFNQDIFIADGTGYIHRMNSERFESKLSFNDRRTIRPILADFNEIWDHSTPNTNFRKLLI